MFKIYFDERFFVISDDFDFCFGQDNGIATHVTSKEQMADLVAYFAASEQTPCLRAYSDKPEKAFKWFCSNFKVVEAAGGLVQNKSGEYLLIYRFAHWDLPKGKCEKNESVEETALREVEEECGLGNLNLYRHLINTYHVYKHNGKLSLKKTYWYSMNYNGKSLPTPQTEEGIERAEWVAGEKLPEYFTTMYHSIRDVFNFR